MAVFRKLESFPIETGWKFQPRKNSLCFCSGSLTVRVYQNFDLKKSGKNCKSCILLQSKR